MRVGIDLTALLPQQTGVDVYLGGLVAALAREPGGIDYVLFVNREDRERFHALAPGFRVVAGALRHRGARLLFQQLALPALARPLGLDVIHSPAFLTPVLRAGARHVVTVYDLTILTMPRCHDRLHRTAVFRSALRSAILRADLVCVPSAAVAAEVGERFPGVRVRVARPGLDARFRPAEPERCAAVARKLGVRRPYVLYVGTLEPRKNLRRLVAAFRSLIAAGRPENLVLAGRLGWDADELLADLAAPELAGRVHRVGYVAAEDLPALYSGARLFVYPSLGEGFGFPPLEAMACGVPVVASLDPALAENLAGAAELVDAADSSALASAAQRLLGNEALAGDRRRLGIERSAGFSWTETARVMVDGYREAAALAVGGSRNARAAERPVTGGVE